MNFLSWLRAMRWQLSYSKAGNQPQIDLYSGNERGTSRYDSDRSSPMASAASAANILLAAAEERGLALDPMKLQKLLFLANGYYLAMTGEPWIEESFQTWEYGPVIPSIYRYFRRFGSSAIERGTRIRTLFSPPPTPAANDELDTALNYVLDTYGSKRAVYLSELTHQIGSPWHKIWSEEGKNRPIPNKNIREYYSHLVTNQN